ncbi:hypothetical protein [Herbaspirillum sp. RV1423]|uniref:hypothetical protein n=1 Tax=Herbaspirillum sp. RV1423 TaxID=1443993 RepID=UPI0004B8A1BA|nr:hypothetical protein [Herbaspirillum sp. RV1423]
MPNSISGGRNDHYFHLHNDETQIKTAQRATFLPTPGNKLSNKFLQSENSLVRGAGRFMKKMRQADLGFRGTADKAKTELYKFGVNQRANFEKWSADGDQQKAAVEAQRVSSRGRLTAKADIKKIRLDYKKEISKAEPDMMDVAVNAYTKEFQSLLTNKGYVKSGGLAETELPEAEIEYMENQERHRVSTTYNLPPLAGIFVAPIVSTRHDNGDTGIKRAIGRIPLHGVIGVANGVQLAKQGVYGAASALAPGNGEMHETFLRRARQASDMRRMNASSLQGSVALDQTFKEANRQRSAFVHERLDQRGYKVVGDGEDLPPEKTRFMARAFNPYVKAAREKMDAGDSVSSESGAKSKPWIQTVASAYAKIANIKTNVSVSYHQSRIEWAEKDIAAGNARAKSKKAYHEGKRFKAMFLSETTSAAAQGTMEEKIDELSPVWRKRELAQSDVLRDDYTGNYGEEGGSQLGEERVPAFNDAKRLEEYARSQQREAQLSRQQLPPPLPQRESPAPPAATGGVREYYAEETRSEPGERVPAFNDTERLLHFAQLKQQRDAGQASPPRQRAVPEPQPEPTAAPWGMSAPAFYDEAGWREAADGADDLYADSTVGQGGHVTYAQSREQFYGSQADSFVDFGSGEGFVESDVISRSSEFDANRVANGRTPADYRHRDDVSVEDRDDDYQNVDSAEVWRSR